ncbi:MAG: hypothetical protein ABI123_00825 [Ginsengibacter sp.]
MDLVIKYERIRNLSCQNFESKFSSNNLFEYNEVLCTAQSCAIEGNSFSVNDTRELKEHGLNLKLYNKTMIEAYEILDHYKAFEFLMKNRSKPVTIVPNVFRIAKSLFLSNLSHN